MYQTVIINLYFHSSENGTLSVGTHWQPATACTLWSQGSHWYRLVSAECWKQNVSFLMANAENLLQCVPYWAKERKDYCSAVSGREKGLLLSCIRKRERITVQLYQGSHWYRLFSAECWKKNVSFLLVNAENLLLGVPYWAKVREKGSLFSCIRGHTDASWFLQSASFETISCFEQDKQFLSGGHFAFSGYCIKKA